ncbi:hypothetical protein ISF08_11205 [Pseudomonas aeruginosa]|uniref:Uncharacterized protein n=2 Tax=Pseudomonas aeruginosa group TaxID=136841 RepID=A0A2R3ITU7_9PSED|nr:MULTISPECIES: hypothetical protein [Pseudomonas]AVK05346.1 hypothetical protein CSB93_6474 [Pseudomonas paraeruginosa]AWE90413.1 hypothetical protein CSC28_5278 [Pseudomonas paraeruginosa]EIU2703041.1 hypothetical protein [Pseudomonas aeruginosa]EKV2939196.1 hypothetical protein [Pseudomonas aeruginosa]EKW7737497.1 hypothetical protein [Pseudomonas aeruginosa]
MAVRKRSETIHLRTTPFVRSTLDVLAALNGKTATAVIEDLLSLAISETELPAPNFIQEKKIVNGRINLKELMESIYTDNALLFKLRLFILVPDAVSEDDKIMCEIILEDLARPASIFRGEEKIFDEKCGGVVKSKQLPSIDTLTLGSSENVLKRYVDFIKKNPDIEIDYKGFIHTIFFKN